MIMARRSLLLALLLVSMLLVKIRLVESRREAGELDRRDAPNTFFGLFVFGGFRSVFLEHLWSKADALYSEGRYWEVVDVFDRIVRLDPRNPRIWRHQAHILTYNLARQQIDREEGWRWYRRAFDHLNTGLEHNPDDFALREQLFRLCFYDLAEDPSLDRRMKMKTGMSGLAWSMKTAGDLRERFPDNPIAHESYRAAAEGVIAELLRDHRHRGASLALDALASYLEEARSRSGALGASPGEIATCRDWSWVMLGVAGAARWPDSAAPSRAELVDRASLDAALDRLESMMSSPDRLVFDTEGETLDARLASLIQVHVMQLCQSACVTKMTPLALSLIPRVNKIAVLARGRLGARRPYYSVSYTGRLEEFIKTDKDLWLLRDAEKPVSKELEARWAEQIDDLDRLIRARAGASDEFKRRVLTARRRT